MADLEFNVAKGRSAYYALLPAASDALVAIPLEAADLVSDATMKDYATVAAILAGASNEQTDLGRKTLTSVTSAPDNTNDVAVVDAAAFTWTATSGDPIGAVIIAYDPDTGTGDDSDLIPLFKYDCAFTPDGTDFTVDFDAAGLASFS